MGRLLPAVVTVVLAAAACGELREPKDPDDLIDYIKSAEAGEIRESWGEQAGQCFTWADYDVFVRNRRAAVVAERVKGTPQFQKLAAMIRALPPTDRERLFARGRDVARPTWAMIGRISTDGTTDAGRRAGLDLARAITDAVKDLASRP
jgi:hypothetical protein